MLKCGVFTLPACRLRQRGREGALERLLEQHVDNRLRLFILRRLVRNGVHEHQARIETNDRNRRDRHPVLAEAAISLIPQNFPPASGEHRDDKGQHDDGR